MTTYRLSADDSDALDLSRADGSRATEVCGDCVYRNLSAADARALVASLEALGHTVKVRPSAQRVLDGGSAVTPEETARGAAQAVQGPQFVGTGRRS